MPAKINLSEKSPLELRRLLDMVKTGNMSVPEKDEWVSKIQDQLGQVTRDPNKEKKILADIQAGMADIDDAG